jgi:hypothetical protein
LQTGSFGSFRALTDVKEQTMVVIELQYDALSRTFTALDDRTVDFFKDGQLYVVAISPSGLDSDIEFLDLRNVPIAHA